MLHRLSKQGVICITQPNHAWLSGQLAQAWGNKTFGQFSPRKDVCRSAELHDIGWLAWEQAPTLNPQTGYPYNFKELPTPAHVSIWSGARKLALPLGRYVALLVSLHGTRLYEKYTNWQNSLTTTHIVKEFLESEYNFQTQIIASLQNDEYYAPYTSRKVIERNRKLIAVWDALSIIFCQKLTDQEILTEVPTADGETTLQLTLIQDKDHHQHISISPWPFQQDSLTLVYEGRHLHHAFDDERTMQEALRNSWVTLSTTLKPE